MSRTIARRIATLGGALGVAVLACAGTASAATVGASAHVGPRPYVANGAHGFDPQVFALRGDDQWGKKPCHHRDDRDRDRDRNYDNDSGFGHSVHFMR